MARLWYNTSNMRPGPSVETPREQPRSSVQPAETKGDPLAPKPTDSELLALLKAKIRRLPTLEKDMPDAARAEITKKYIALREDLAAGMAALDDNEIKEINEGFESRIEQQVKKNKNHFFSEPVQAMVSLYNQGNNFLANKAREGTTLSNLHDGVRAGMSSAALWSATTRFVPGPWGIVAGIATGIGGTYVASKLGGLLSKFGVKPETGQKVAQWITAAGATAAATIGTVATGGIGPLATIGLVGGLGGVSMLLNRSVRKGQEEESKEKLRTELLEKLRKEEEEAARSASTAIASDPAVRNRRSDASEAPTVLAA